jgi:hypothetical protein
VKQGIWDSEGVGFEKGPFLARSRFPVISLIRHLYSLFGRVGNLAK